MEVRLIIHHVYIVCCRYSSIITSTLNPEVNDYELYLVFEASLGPPKLPPGTAVAQIISRSFHFYPSSSLLIRVICWMIALLIDNAPSAQKRKTNEKDRESELRQPTPSREVSASCKEPCITRMGQFFFLLLLSPHYPPLIFLVLAACALDLPRPLADPAKKSSIGVIEMQIMQMEFHARLSEQHDPGAPKPHCRLHPRRVSGRFSRASSWPKESYGLPDGVP